MKTINCFILAMLSFATGLLYVDRFYPLLPKCSQHTIPSVSIIKACGIEQSSEQIIPKLYEFLNSFVDLGVYAFAWATLIITIIGIFIAAYGILNRIWRREEINKIEKEVEEHKNNIRESIDLFKKEVLNSNAIVKNEVKGYTEELESYKIRLSEAGEDISFLEQSRRDIMKVLLVLIEDCISRYENLSKANTTTMDDDMKYLLATSIVKYLELIIQYASVREISQSLLSLHRSKNSYIGDELDKMKEKLLVRCIRDPQFNKDAFVFFGIDLNNNNDSSNPFESLIESLKKIMKST